MLQYYNVFETKAKMYVNYRHYDQRSFNPLYFLCYDFGTAAEFGHLPGLAIFFSAKKMGKKIAKHGWCPNSAAVP